MIRPVRHLAGVAVLSAALVASVTPAPSNAITLPGLGIPFPTNEDAGVPETQFIDNEEVWAGVPAGPGGGLLCIVDAETDQDGNPTQPPNPDDGSLSCASGSKKIGETNATSGDGSLVYALLALPPLWSGQSWVILADNAPPLADHFSLPFRVDPCTLGTDCPIRVIDPTEKNLRSQLQAVGARGACYAMRAIATALALKAAWTTASFFLGVGWGITGSIAGTVLVLAATELSSEVVLGTSLKDMIRAAMESEFCRIADKWERASHDPPDSEFETVAPPVVVPPPTIEDPVGAALATNLAEQAAYVDALVTAVERYQGAVAAANTAGIRIQANAVATFSLALEERLAQGSVAVHAFAEQLAADPDIQKPSLTASQLAEVTAIQDRIRTDGFLPSEIASLSDAGMSPAEIEDARQVFIQDLSQMPVGVDLDETVNALGIEMDDSRAAFIQLARDAHGVYAQLDSAPLASFTASAPLGHSPLDVTFTDTSTDADGDALSSAWEFGDGTTGTGSPVHHVYVQDGQYTAKLTAADGLRSAATTQSIDVGNHSPVASFTVAPMPVVVGATETFTSTSTDPDGDVVTASWDFGDGSTGNGTPVDHTYTAAGTYSATLTVSDGTLSDSASTVIPVTGNRPPIPVDDNALTLADTAVGIDVLANDSDPDGDPLSVTASTDGGHGTVRCTTAGICTYTPASGFTGSDVFTYTVSDGRGGTATGTVSVTVNPVPVNLPPVAGDDLLNGVQETPASLNVLANDYDPDGDTLSVNGTTNGAHGSVSCKPTGSCTYTPDPGFHGSDVFTYTISDGRGGSDTGQVDVTITPADPSNHPPVATDDSLTVKSNLSGSVYVLGNDSDPDGDALSVVANTDPAHGSVECFYYGYCTYTPAHDYVGPDGFDYTVADGRGGAAQAHVTVTVEGNHPPVATDDSLTVKSNLSDFVYVLGNDSDPDFDSLSVVANTDPAHGSVDCVAYGYCQYTPAHNYDGPDGFDYTVSDGRGGMDTATVVVTVEPNHPPVAADDSLTVTVNKSGSINVVGNDSDPDLDALSVVANTDPAHGSIECVAYGSCTYTPAHDYVGPDSFDYTVSDGRGGTDTATVVVTVDPNHPPVAADDVITTFVGAKANTNVLVNDTDPDADSLTVAGNANATHGSVNCSSEGVCIYTPDAGFTGSDSFTYTVSDGVGGTDSATVDVAVAVSPVVVRTQSEINAAVARGVDYIDAHQNLGGSFGISFPVAETSTAILAYGVLDRGDITNLDDDKQAHLRSAITWLLGQQDQTSGAWSGYTTYYTGLALTALSSAEGIDSAIPAAIEKGRAWLIAAQNAPPSVTGNPNSLDCSSADDSPTASYCGGWNYDADGGRSDESNTGFAMTGLAVTGGVPAAAAEVNIGWQHHVQELTSNPFATRNDGGGGYQPYALFSGANDTGSLVFGYGYDGVPADNPQAAAAIVFGQDILNEYELAKETYRTAIYHLGLSEDGICVISYAGGPCDWAFQSDGGFHYSLWALTKGLGHYIKDNLADGTNWYPKVADLLLLDQAADGSWPQDGRDDGTILFATGLAIDALGRVGTPHTLNVAKDGTGTGTVSSTPVGIDCGATCKYDFPDGSSVILSATADAHSTFTGWSGGGCSGTGDCIVKMNASKDVTATFTLVNHPPVGVADSYSVAQDTILTVTAPGVLANDTDADGDSLTAAKVADPTHGTVTLGADGSFVYTPTAAYSGPDSFTYNVSDGTATVGPVTVSLTITQASHDPVATDDRLTTGVGIQGLVNVLFNDHDPDGDPLSVTGHSQGAHGAVDCTTDGVCTYDPAPGFAGTDSFTYDISDGQGGTDRGTVRVTVFDSCALPTLPGGVFVTGHDPDFHAFAGQSNATGAQHILQRAIAYVTSDAASPSVLLVTDLRNPGGGYSDPRLGLTAAGITYDVADQGSGTSGVLDLHSVDFADYDAVVVASDFGGWLTQDELDILNGRSADMLDFVNGGGGLVVLAEPGSDGSGRTTHDQFGFLPFIVGAPPLIEVETDTVTALGASIGLTDADVSGNFSHVFFSSGGGLGVVDTDSNGRTISLAELGDLLTGNGVIAPCNHPPAATDDSADAVKDGPTIHVDVLANDTDPDVADVLSVQSVDTTGTSGTVANDGSDVTYTPAAGFAGTDTFAYTVSDGHGGTDTATVTVTVKGNSPPVATDDTAIANEHGPAVHVDVLANDTDPESDALTVTSVDTTGTQGTVSNNGTDVTYDPNGAFEGLANGQTDSDTFSYAISDGHGGTDTATVTVTIHGQNDAPSLAVVADQTIPEMVLFNTLALAGSDPDGDSLTYSVESGPAGLTVNATSGVVSWTPTEAQGPGSYPVTVRVTDPDGLFAERSFTITVTEVNRDPALAAIADHTVYPGDPVSLTASATDPDLPANTLTYSLISGPLGATVNPTTGAFAWTASSTLGDYAVTIGVSDGAGGSAQRSFSIHVVRDTTTLTLGGDSAGQYTDKATITAILEVGSTGVSGATVTISLGAVSVDATTNASGLASATFTIPGPAGSLPIAASFAGTSSKAPSSTSGTFTVDREDSTVVYSGDVIGLVGDTLHLSATFTDSAAAGFSGNHPETGAGATIGDITKARIAFAVYNAATCLAGSPLTTLSAFVTDTGTAGDGIGTATVTWSTSSEGSFCIVPFLVGATGTGANGYYTAPPAEAAGLAVFIDTAGKVTGGGWVAIGDGRGNFGFNAVSNGSKVKGNLVFIERTVYKGTKAMLIIKSNAIDSLRTSGSIFPITATLSGKASFKYISSIDGSTLFESGNATFTATVVDTDVKTPPTGDSFAIRALDKTGAVLVDVGTTPLGSGNIVAHLK